MDEMKISYIFWLFAKVSFKLPKTAIYYSKPMEKLGFLRYLPLTDKRHLPIIAPLCQ